MRAISCARIQALARASIDWIINAVFGHRRIVFSAESTGDERVTAPILRNTLKRA